MTPSTPPGWEVVDIALDMLKRGQHLNADHPLVVVEDEIARLREREAEKDEAIGNYMKLSSEQADESRKWRFRAEAAEAEVQRYKELYEALVRDVGDYFGSEDHARAALSKEKA